MFFADRLTLDKPRRTADGYMAIHAKAARIGIYQYLGREIDPEGKHFSADQVVNVYRPPEEVFDALSLGSFIGKPITDDHPSKPVTADNWRELARGTIMGAVKEGEYVGFDLAFLDAATIRAVDEGKQELSNGYSSDVSIEDGTAPDGTPYQAVQRQIRGNHVAVVDKGRAGSTCRIGDAAACTVILSDEVKNLLTDEQTYADAGDADNKNHQRRGPQGRETVDKGISQMATEIILVDGLQVEVTDAAKAAIGKLQGQLADSKAAAEKAGADVAKLTTDNATLTADKAKLEQQIKDAELTPAKLQDAAKAYAKTVESAKKIAPAVTLADDADEPTIRRTVVADRLGDAAKDWSDDQVAISFDTLATQAADAKPDPLRQAIGSGSVHTINDAAVRDTVRSLQY